MKYLIRNFFKLAGASVASLGMIFMVAPSAFACDLPNRSFLGFPSWWEFLQGQDIGGKCAPVVNWPGGVWNILLAAIDILLHVAGIAAVVSILVASVMYVTSAGSPDRAKSALDRIIASLVGLAITVIAAATVKFIGDRLAGTSTANSYGLPQVGSQGALTTGLDIFFGLIGVIAFLMAVIGGFNFVLSQGNPDKTARARNTLIYAAVGLAVAATGAFIVSVVIGKS